MSEILAAMLSGGIGAAVATGIMGIILYKIKRADIKADDLEEKENAERTALRYIMLFVIRQQGTEFVRHGTITWEDRKMLHKWHDLYHNGLGGNGDADLLMSVVDNLPLVMEE